MIYLRNMLSRHEIHANYYFRRVPTWLPKRGQNVVENMQQSTAVADGLAVMAQAYALMDLDDLARHSQVLCLTTPTPMQGNCSIATNSGSTLERSW